MSAGVRVCWARCFRKTASCMFKALWPDPCPPDTRRQAGTQVACPLPSVCTLTCTLAWARATSQPAAPPGPSTACQPGDPLAGAGTPGPTPSMLCGAYARFCLPCLCSCQRGPCSRPCLMAQSPCHRVHVGTSGLSMGTAAGGSAAREGARPPSSPWQPRCSSPWTPASRACPSPCAISGWPQQCP